MDDKTEFEIARGERAQQVLREPLLQEAFTEIERELIEQWQNSPVRDVEGREKLYLTLRCLQKLQGHLVSVVETGKVAQATLAQRIGQSLSRAFSR
jgi:hypothetical protein